jgi:hypothetical protein
MVLSDVVVTMPETWTMVVVIWVVIHRVTNSCCTSAHMITDECLHVPVKQIYDSADVQS